MAGQVPGEKCLWRAKMLLCQLLVGQPAGGTCSRWARLLLASVGQGCWRARLRSDQADGGTSSRRESLPAC